MLIAMNRICVLILCIQIASCKFLNQIKRVKCDDCVPIRQCEAAAPYMDPTDEDFEYISQFYCGVTISFNVCCSQLAADRRKIAHDAEHPNLKLLPDSCGHIHNFISSRITAGSFASLYEFPWMVLISYRTSGGIQFQCSGTLINSRYVLTAAHCVENKIIAGVRVGEYEVGKETDCDENVCESHIQDLNVKLVIRHDNYSRFDNFVNDIALLRLEENVDMSYKNTGTICLPISKELQNSSLANKYGTVAGWGNTEFGRESVLLLKVTVPIRPFEDCQNDHSHMSDSKQICAGILDRDSCKGDSGGPLIIEDIYKGEDRYVQYGIVSNGPIICGSDQPAVYTDVRKYMVWILDNIRE